MLIFHGFCNYNPKFSTLLKYLFFFHDGCYYYWVLRLDTFNFIILQENIITESNNYIAPQESVIIITVTIIIINIYRYLASIIVFVTQCLSSPLAAHSFIVRSLHFTLPVIIPPPDGYYHCCYHYFLSLSCLYVKINPVVSAVRYVFSLSLLPSPRALVRHPHPPSYNSSPDSVHTLHIHIIRSSLRVLSTIHMTFA